MANIKELILKVISDIQKSDRDIIFTLDNGDKYMMFHEQDCCESVMIEDINGDLSDLINTPILSAEETTDCGYDGYDHITWTFYHLATIKGYVTIRWLGSSNGYYSESVNFVKL